jgi:hypothetical protein
LFCHKCCPATTIPHLVHTVHGSKHGHGRVIRPGRLVARFNQFLEALMRKGKSPAQRLLKARILLKADISEPGEGSSDSRVIEALETSASMVYRVRKQLVEEGFEAVSNRKQRATPALARIFDGEREAKLIALACSKPHKGRARWTLRLLENKVVELHIVDRASASTIGRTHETSKQRIGETRVSIPMKPGRPVRWDYEYKRHGTANLFMMFAPLEGWRHIKVADRHTAVDRSRLERPGR